MENKNFKVGDKVKVKNNLVVNERYDGLLFSRDMTQYKGGIYEISKVDTDNSYHLKGCADWWFSNSMLLAFKFTKDDLKEGDIVTLRNGDRLIYANGEFTDCSDDNDNYLEYLSELEKNLTYEGNHRDNDIVKVERPTGYNTLFERQEEEVKEMTLKEVCEKLGYEIKIVKEEK